MTTVKQIKEGAKLPEPIYASKPYVILNKDNVVLHAGTHESIINIIGGTYYDDCVVERREHDLYLNDNTKIKNDQPKPTLTTAEWLDYYRFHSSEFENFVKFVEELNAAQTAEIEQLRKFVEAVAEMSTYSTVENDYMKAEAKRILAGQS